MTPEEEAFSKRWTNSCVHVVQLDNKSYAILDRLFYVRGFWDPYSDNYCDFMNLLQKVLDNPPAAPGLKTKASAAQLLKEWGL